MKSIWCFYREQSALAMAIFTANGRCPGDDGPLNLRIRPIAQGFEFMVIAGAELDGEELSLDCVLVFGGNPLRPAQVFV